MRRITVVVLMLLACDALAAPTPEEVAIPGKVGKLQAWLWKPAGKGPFPVLVYNHGSERRPIAGTEAAIGPYFVAHGYAALFPHRRGSGTSEGTYWRDVADRSADVQRAAIDALVAENDDVVSAGSMHD